MISIPDPSRHHIHHQNNHYDKKKDNNNALYKLKHFHEEEQA